MPTLQITATHGGAITTVDLSQYLVLTEDGGADPYDPAFTQRIFSRSLLKEGATLALQQLVEKEQTWPVLLGPFATSPQMASFIEQVNQVISTPGAVLSWQDDGMSQPTYFDLLSGELQIAYSYRKAQQAYTAAKLLTFSQPLGRTAGPRPYAAASAVGPLLMISPYASGGQLAPGASTQAGVPGFGAQQQGASSGVFYWGAPSLAGDAPALLQVSYVGPLPSGASGTGTVPYAVVSLLPDSLYRPLVTAPEITARVPLQGVASEFLRVQPTSVASTYRQLWNSNHSHGAVQWAFAPLPVASDAARDPALSWAGQHRLFAIARASGVFNSGVGYNPALVQSPGGLANAGASTPVALGFDWGLYDLGTFALRASEFPVAPALVNGYVGPSQALDLAALVMLPDRSTWLFAPTALQGSQYGVPSSWYSSTDPPALQAAPYTNTLLLDDLLGDQFIYGGASQAFAPSPIGSVPSSARMTQFTRGLVPRPDPKDGLPIIAILGVPQAVASMQAYPSLLSIGGSCVGASWNSPQNLLTMAQVNVLERSRYVLP